jgi:hypothetical protein
MPPAVARLTLAAALLLTLAACGSPPPAPADEEAADEAEAAALGRDTDETVVDDMLQTQDRARAVEDLTLGRKDDLDQALEESSGAAADDE